MASGGGLPGAAAGGADEEQAEEEGQDGEGQEAHDIRNGPENAQEKQGGVERDADERRGGQMPEVEPLSQHILIPPGVGRRGGPADVKAG